MTHIAYLGLGSNLGDRRGQLDQALTLLQTPWLEIREISSLYESEPVGPVTQQPPFYNAVVQIHTRFTPRGLLQHCLAVESLLGRTRRVAKGPRTIDLDVLLVDDVVWTWPELVLPHPELARRLFVLEPLLEIAPQVRDPRNGQVLSLARARLHGEQRVRRMETLWRKEGPAQPPHTQSL
jgi:2-amino-4-hydroxy-6-hydroxymethyldihydropteridine diphosphokinase